MSEGTIDRWVRPLPRFTIAVFALAAILPVAVFFLEYSHRWTPLQKHNLLTYLFTSISGSGRYRVLALEYQKGPVLATDADVVAAPIPRGESPRAGIPFALTDQAKRRGATRLAWHYWQRIENAKLHAMLREWVYNRQSLADLSRHSLLSALVVLLLLPVALWQDRRESVDRERGRILQGPRLVTRADFNRAKAADGVGFVTLESLAMQERLRRDPMRRMVRIPRNEESSHMLIMGDSGTGKSSLIRQLLIQIAERGETAIVYDPALEYTPEFFDRTRGDQLLNPVDIRMPYWTPTGEVRYPAEAQVLAHSLFPDKPNEQPFFQDSARRIFAHLLRYDPSPQDLTHWMSQPEEIDTRLVGTECAALVAPTAGGQRSAVLSTFNQAASALRLLPRQDETKQQWTAAAWARSRKGWLFLPSTPEIREALRPLVSLWLDSLLLRLMTPVQGNTPAVWVVIDELASLQRLPQLPTAITEARKANLRLVLGFQGQSQVESRYGHEAETMLSQPMTKVFLRTSEPRAAEWISKSIGDVEIERLKESRTDQIPTVFDSGPQNRRSKTLYLERKIEPLVMPSVIGSLPNLSGYIKSKGLVVAATFPYIPQDQRQPGFQPRPLRELELLPTLPDVCAASAGGKEKKEFVRQLTKGRTLFD